jgi:hypothetical protein
MTEGDVTATGLLIVRPFMAAGFPCYGQDVAAPDFPGQRVIPNGLPNHPRVLPRPCPPSFVSTSGQNPRPVRDREARLEVHLEFVGDLLISSLPSTEYIRKHRANAL